MNMFTIFQSNEMNWTEQSQPQPPLKVAAGR